MTRIIVELDRRAEARWLLDLLRRLGIPFKQEEVTEDLKEAISTLEQGCDMGSFGDPREYQREVRADRSLSGSEWQ